MASKDSISKQFRFSENNACILSIRRNNSRKPFGVFVLNKPYKSVEHCRSVS